MNPTPLSPPPPGISFGDAARTPVAYGGKPACSAGLTASGEGSLSVALAGWGAVNVEIITN